MELLGGFQLEARDLQHGPRVVGRTRRSSDIDGDADVAADRAWEIRPSEDLAEQRGGGRLAVRPVMATILPLRNRAASSISPITGGQARAPAPAAAYPRHAGADHDQVLAAEGPLAVAAGLDRDAFVEQRRDLFAQAAPALRIRDGDLRASRLQEQRRRQPGLPRPTTRTLFAFRSIMRSSVLGSSF